MTNFIPFIDSLGLIQGVILGTIIIVLGRGKLASWFFGLFVITYAIELGDAILLEFGYLEDNHRLAFAPLNFYFLNLPLLYLYLEKIVGKFSWKTHIWWFLPGIFEFSIFITLFTFYAQFNKESLLFILEMYTHISMVFYVVVAFYIIFKTWGYQNILNRSHTSDKTSNLKWIIYICVFLIIYMMGFVYIEIEYNKVIYISLISSNVLFIYLISILGIKQKYLEVEGANENTTFDGIELKAEKISLSKEEKAIKDNDSIHKPGSTNAQSDLKKTEEIDQKIKLDQEVSIFNYLDQKIVSEKHFLDPEINVFNLSRKFRLNSRRFSEVIKNQTGKSFRSYINTHRVNYAKKLIQSPNNDHLTMVSIGYDSGFQSKSAYYSSFKEITNLTPVEYKKHIRLNA